MLFKLARVIEQCSLGEHFKITTYFKFDIVAHQKRLISTDSFLGKPLDKNVQNQTGQIEI